MSSDRPTATRYRVEYHEGSTVHCLGSDLDAAPHHSSLEPFIIHLLRQGMDGMLHLIDETTEELIARRRIRPFPSKARDRFRQFRH
jgi:hypothetical protein